MTQNDIIAEGVRCLREECTALSQIAQHLDEHFAQAVEIIAACKGKVIVTGVGKSGHVGSKIAATLASTGTPAFFLNPLDAYHGDLGMIGKEDVLLAISYSGNTDELMRFIPLLTEQQIPIVALTGSNDSLLARYATAHILVAVDHEADALNLAPTASTTVAMAVGDALASALMRVRCFEPTDFARLHPGGDLGRRLLAKVEDIMVHENLPILTPTMPMGEAIDIVTHGALGLGIVVDEAQQLAGIITDGDIRRAMINYKDQFLTTPVEHIMCRTPKTIRRDARIVDAGEKMNHHSIHSLVVMDEQEHVCGVIDSFSCLPGTRFYH